MGFLDRLLGRVHGVGSKDIAKERLQVVLVSDRTNITPALLQTLKDEIIAGISKHVEIDQDRMAVTLTQGRQYHRIVADIPVIRTRELPAEARPRRRNARRRPIPEGDQGIRKSGNQGSGSREIRE
jgi:cell division topological specificity factor